MSSDVESVIQAIERLPNDISAGDKARLFKEVPPKAWSFNEYSSFGRHPNFRKYNPDQYMRSLQFQGSGGNTGRGFWKRCGDGFD
ncbi:hypothetical protein [Coleofasciculus sp.]|uniref:hypothetical protein n=1 Tax=Coleofasciculus sp. TaxID=3100458 RepID=UPI0039F92674